MSDQGGQYGRTGWRTVAVVEHPFEPFTASEFPQVNVRIAENQPEYETLPTFKEGDGKMTFCWKLSWRDRARVLLYGKVWHQVLTFNSPLQPQYLTTDEPRWVYGETKK